MISGGSHQGCRLRPRQFGDPHEVEGSEEPEDGERTENDSGVADAVGDECLVGRRGGRVLVEVEADQQIGAQTDALPADKHHQVVVGQNQGEHGEHEQVQVSEEAVVAAFVRHVSRAVDVDKRADAGDKQQPYAAQRVEQHTGVDHERGGAAAVQRVKHVAAAAAAQPGKEHVLVARQAAMGELQDGQHGPDERQGDRAHADGVDHRLGQPPSKKQHQCRACRRQQRYDPDGRKKKHFSSLCDSFSLSRLSDGYGTDGPRSLPGATTSTDRLHPCSPWHGCGRRRSGFPGRPLLPQRHRRQ